MSLYYDSASLLVSGDGLSGSLKSRVFNSKDLKSPPKQVFALVSEAAKWSPVLTEVVEKSQLLQMERKLSPHLALLLVHDLLLNRRGISAPSSHPLRTSVEKHKARLSAELTKARLKRGFASIEELRADIESGDAQRNSAANAEMRGNDDRSQDGVVANEWPHPRWVRANSIKTNMVEQLNTTFAGYEHSTSLEQLLNISSSGNQKVLHVDRHISNLLALPPSADLSKTSAYLKGLIIFQDKASCFPAYLLDLSSADGDCVDACAAPGNKTTHLAAILQENDNPKRKSTIYACERDEARGTTLLKMIHLAGAERTVAVKFRKDFLRVDPKKPPWNSVGALLLDPSCSGSGIVGRDEQVKVVLPRKEAIELTKVTSKKRKRKSTSEIIPASTLTLEALEETPVSEKEPLERLSARLEALSTFQLNLLLHAFEFPKARKITYSTCSIYAQENEHVVMIALNSPIARRRGWHILQRNEQVSGMKAWGIRGDLKACKEVQTDVVDGEQVAEACIRCERGTKEGTQGFFVAAFVRNGSREDQAAETLPEEEEEWEGFSDDKADS